MDDISLFFGENDISLSGINIIILYEIRIREIGMVKRDKIEFLNTVNNTAGKDCD